MVLGSYHSLKVLTMSKIISLLVLFVLAALSGCHGKPDPEVAAVPAVVASAPVVVPYEKWSRNATISQRNSEANARAYRNITSRLAGYDFVPRADSLIGPNCSVGRGWVEVVFTRKHDTDKDANGDSVIIRKIAYCSTLDKARSCMLKDLFDASDYKQAYNTCQDGMMPDPLPQI
jgi:hypothetical protein